MDSGPLSPLGPPLFPQYIIYSDSHTLSSAPPFHPECLDYELHVDPPTDDRNGKFIHGPLFMQKFNGTCVSAYFFSICIDQC